MFDFRYLDKEQKNGIFFPGSAEANYNHIGEGEGKFFNVNLGFNADQDNPLNDLDYTTVFKSVVLPITEEFAPDLVIVSQVGIKKISFYAKLNAHVFCCLLHTFVYHLHIFNHKSKGYDALKGDLGGYALTPNGFANMTQVTRDVKLK